MQRRSFLKAMGMGPPLLAFGNHSLVTLSQTGERDGILVVIFQRGGMDGLMAVPPLNDPHLGQYRPRLKMSVSRNAGEDALFDLDGRHGLHPGFKDLAPLFHAGRLAVIHGAGLPLAVRSHFDAQDYMESGTPGRKGTPSGWLNRTLAGFPPNPSSFRALAMEAALPRALYGSQPVLTLGSFSPKGIGRSRLESSLEALYARDADSHLQIGGTGSFEAMRALAKLDRRPYRPSAQARYPQSKLGKDLRRVAQLIKADLGVRIAALSSTGWDTHSLQGTSRGAFARAAGNLGAAMAAFWQDLEALQDRLLVLTMTEFGRTVRENGSGGTDHGRASCFFALGARVHGGRVHGAIPPLAPKNLAEGRDLPVTTDFRAVLTNVAEKHLGVATPELFPGWRGQPLPFLG